MVAARPRGRRRGARRRVLPWLALAFPGQLGLGDVRLGGLLGGYLAFLGWPDLVSGTLLGWVLAAVAMGFRRPSSTRRRLLPLAPFLFAGTLVAVLVSR